MPTEDEQQHSVNDISHLFLSNVRSIAGNGMPRPQRKPPGAHSSPASSPGSAVPSHSSSAVGGTAASVDLTPEEYDHVIGVNGAATPANESLLASGIAHAADVAPVTALLAAHLGARQLERAREYARHVAASGERVGLIDLDVSEFRLYCFDPAVEPGAEIESRQSVATGIVDPRAIAEALEELNVDVDRWLLLLPNLRTPEAKSIVRACERWTLLTTCDHDGVVSAYRTLKGVIDARIDDATQLAMATLDAAGDAEATRVQQKLVSVCQQFLGWEIETETPIRYAAVVAEHALMNCRVTRDKAQLASAPHWAVVGEMLARPRRGTAHTEQPALVVPVVASVKPAEVAVEPTIRHETVVEPAIRRVEPVEPTAAALPSTTPAKEATQEVRMPNLFIAPTAAPARMAAACDDVIELPGDAGDINSILSAILRRPELGFIQCPLDIPACPTSRLTVTRDRGLALVAAASRGLAELRAIGKAFQWMLENRALIAMAMPQFAIDATRTPSIVLLVDQNDITGEFLQPMMQAEHVTVRAYRTLRWAGRTGLLLEAA